MSKIARLGDQSSIGSSKNGEASKLPLLGSLRKGERIKNRRESLMIIQQELKTNKDTFVVPFLVPKLLK